MIETILIITEQALIHCPLIIGAYISISLMKLPDFSIESAYASGAICASITIPLVKNLPSPIALSIIIAAALLGGTIVGLVSSLLTQKARIAHLLSCIITIGIFHGLNQLIAGAYISLSKYPDFLSYEIIPFHPELAIVMIITGLCSSLFYYFFTTELGYSWAVFGSNPYFFSHYRISSSYVFMTGIIIANALAGLSGYLVAQSTGFADINMGIGKLLLCITGLILGKTLYKKNVSLIIPLAGIISYFTIQQLLLKIGFDLRYFTMVQALVIVVILITHFQKNKPLNTDHLGV